MPLLTTLRDGSLDPGDILRLSDNYDLGPGSGPVDLMVFHPRDDESGLGLIVASGYKAGLVLHVFPTASNQPDGGLSVDWLLANWHDWFVYTYHRAQIPVESAVVLRKDARTLPQEL